LIREETLDRDETKMSRGMQFYESSALNKNRENYAYMRLSKNKKFGLGSS